MSKTKFTLEDLFNLNGSVIYNPDDYKSTEFVTIDSRNVRKGAIFVAIKGKRHDGHNFVRQAIENGAGAVIISRRKLNDFDDVEIPIVTVPNTIKAYGELAKIKRAKMNYLVIGITGSNGKTTTKEFTAKILSEKFKVHFTEANNNNHIGVPLTILSAKNKDEVLVLELGTNHFGEIEYIANIAQPDISLITNIGTAHTKYLKNKRGVLKEKLSLFEITEKRGGKILLNIDDKLLAKQKSKFSNVITYGFSNNAEIKIEKTQKHSEDFPTINFTYGKRKLQIKPNVFGKANLQNVINAVVIALVAGLNNTQIKRAIKNLQPYSGRFEIIRLTRLTIIDDSYNASPESMKSAIESFAEFPSEKKIAILGDMLELGNDAEKLHSSLSSTIKKAKLDEVLLLGKNMKTLENIKGANVKHFSNLKSLLKYIDKNDFTGASVLVKASRGMHFEKVIEKLKEDYD